jgi:Winged helix DNA-binding domain
MMPASDVLTHRELNRALLARQLLLEPDTERDAVAAVEHLVGMQAQAPFPPYYGLWSRLDGFRPDDLATLISTRNVVRIALMRGTIHLVSARDCLPLRAVMQPVLDRAFRSNQYKRLTGVDLAELAARGRELVDGEPMTFSELGKALAERWPGNPPADLAQGVRALVPLVQVPPRAVWGQSGVPRHTSAEAWLSGGAAGVGGAAGAGGAVDHAALVRRYLAAFGPATVRDIQAWSGLTGLRAVVETLRSVLVTFRDEGGAELFDLPDAPRPPGDTPVPVRLVGEFDNLVLSHADRTRIFAGVDMARMYSINGIVPGSVLVDGFVAGLWRIATTRKTATLTLELWEGVPDRRAVTSEAERLLAFAAPGATHDIRFAPSS